MRSAMPRHSCPAGRREYWSVGIGDLDAEAYAQSDNPMAWALSAWMRQPRQDRAVLRVQLQEKILRFVGDPWYRSLLVDTVRSYFRLNRREQVEEAEILRSQPYEEVNEMLQTEFGRMRRDTLRENVIEVIQARFPDAPASISQRIARMQSESRLQEWLRRAAVANSLEEIEQLLDS